MKIVVSAVAAVLVLSAADVASGEVCPGPLSTVDINGHGLIKAVDAAGDLVVTLDQRGITTWSIEDPGRPTELGHYAIDRERMVRSPFTPTETLHIELLLGLDGQWACVVPSFDCFDLSDPSRPAPQQWAIDEWPCDGSYVVCDPDDAFALSDDVMAVVEEEREIWLLDLEAGRPTRWIRPQSLANRFEDIASIAISDGVLLVLEADRDLTAWDLEDLDRPVRVGSDALEVERQWVEGWKLHPHPDGAIVLGFNSQGWQEIAGISTLQLPDLPSAELSHILEWDPVDDFELVGDRGGALMRTWDWDLREWVYHVAEVRAPSPFSIYVRSNVESDETEISVAADKVVGWPGRTRLDVYSVGDQLDFSGSSASVGEVLDLDIRGDIAVVANGPEGITVLDLADPERPVPLSTLQIPHVSVEWVRLRGATAFLLSEGSIASVDLSEPTEPRLIKHRYVADICCGLELSGDVAVVGSWEDCTLPLLDITDPTRMLTVSMFDYCVSGSGDWTRSLQVVDQVAFVETSSYLYGIDISDPFHPVTIVEHRDRDFYGFHAEESYLVMSYHDEMRMCQITDGGDVVVGRVYENLQGYGLDSPRDDLVVADAYRSQTLVDFSDPIEPSAYEIRPTDNRLPAGTAVGDVWLRPFRTVIDLMSLECRPPDAAFRRSGSGLEIWFEDTSRYRVVNRLWDFGDGATSTEYAPAHTYAGPGRYRVTLTVGNDSGTDTVSRILDLTGARELKNPSAASREE